jgi:diguanylate cyclase (GGDEF)-like protein
MAAQSASTMGTSSSSRGLFHRLLTEQLRHVLERRALRIGAVGVMFILASLLSLLPTPFERSVVDAGWLFMVPVAISAIAGGLKEGLVVALIASALAAVFSSAAADQLSMEVVLSAGSARFALYGITAGILGAFAEAHYSVQGTLRDLASIDPLTKVANVDRFYAELKLMEGSNTDFAILLVDLDGLKALNDEYGHQTGSAAIQAVANVLVRVVRASDTVARYGGDEFVVLLRQADRTGAQIVMNRVFDMLTAEPVPGAPNLKVSVSAGVALRGEDGTTTEELLRAADEAMYAQKKARKAS